jgi:hypothetical protein
VPAELRIASCSGPISIKVSMTITFAASLTVSVIVVEIMGK